MLPVKLLHQNINILSSLFLAILVVGVSTCEAKLLEDNLLQESKNTLYSEQVDSTETKNKWALIVAISDYPDSTGWNKINAENDVPIITDVLLKQGFPEHQIRVLKDSVATKQKIIDTFQSHLIKNVQSGDIVYIHFSSHGQQIFDDNSDEIDGFDESIIPVNANRKFRSDQYEGQHHLRDDELGKLINQIRSQVGSTGNVLTVLDACHSGTATRGFASARGTKEVMAPPGYNPVISRSSGNGFYLKSDVEKLNDNLAPTVTISGASANELNFETRDADNRKVGSLSYALSLALQDANKSTTYRELFDKIKIEMNRLAPRQTPQIEGVIDQQVFGGNVIDQQPYFVPQEWIDEQQLVLNAGVIHGFTQNSTVDIYLFETQNFEDATSLAKATIISATTLRSTIEIAGDASALKQNKLKIVLDEQSFGNLTIRLQNRLTENEEQVSVLLDSLDNSSFIELVEETPDLVLTNADTSGRGNSISLLTAQELALYQTDWNKPVDKIAGALKEEFKQFAKVRLLRNLSLSSNELKVKLEIIPIEYRMENGYPVITDSLDIKEFTTETGHIVLPVGQAFFLRVIHDGSEPAFYTVINFTPSGEAQLTVPFREYTPGDFVIQPFQRKSLTNNLLQVAEPTGIEAFKLIATKEPLDLTPILLRMRGPGTRSSSVSNPFQTLLEDVASSSRSEPLGVPPAVANTFTITFKVVDK